MGKINPKQLQGMMKQMGIHPKELDAKRVIFELEGKNLVIDNPSVTVMTMQGKKTFTVMGDPKEEQKGLPKDDIEMVASSANVSFEKAEKALKEANGDLAQAIAKLKK